MVEDKDVRTKLTNQFSDLFNIIKTFRNNTEGIALSKDLIPKDVYNEDIIALRNYQNELLNGKNKTEALEASMMSASRYAREFAESTNTAGFSADNFANFLNQQEIALIAQDKSLSNCKSLINEYNSGCANCGVSQKEFVASVNQSNPALGTYLSNVKSGEASFGGYAKALIGAKLQTIGLQAASMALNAVIGMGIGLAISAAIKGIDYLIHREDNLIEKSEEAANTIKSLNDSYSSAKKTVDDCTDSFIKLSKGVDLATGKNLTLSDGDYQEFLDISNQLAETFPTLTRHYDENGNAIVQLNGDAQTITDQSFNLYNIKRRKRSQYSDRFAF